MNIAYQGWHFLVRTAVSAVVVYASVIVLLRVSGKRTLSKWNAFDLVVTIALGSTIATAIISKRTSLAQAVLALIMLIGLQFVITWSSVRVRWVRRIVKSRPTALLIDGKFQTEAMARCRVTKSEVLAAVRTNGHGKLEKVAAVVLETDGTFSVVTGERATDLGALEDVEGVTVAQRDRPTLPPGSRGSTP